MNLLMKNNTTVGLYVRLSREETEKESDSIENQIAFSSDYIKDNNMNLYKTYIDDGFSGGNFDRPRFQEMLEDIKNGKINCVLVKDISRFGRNLSGSGMYIEEFFPRYNIRLISILDYYDTVTATEDDDNCLIMKMFLSDYYLKDIRKKFMATLHYKANNEFLLFGMLYGYKRGEKKNIEIDPEPYAVIQRIVDLLKSGKEPQQVANILKNDKVLIPRCYRYYVDGKDYTKAAKDPYCWGVSTIIGIVLRYEYCGHAVNLKTKTVNKKSVKNKDVIIIKNTHPVIISEEDHNYFVERFTKNVKQNHSKEKLSNVHCSKCNIPMTGRIDIASNYKVYKCKCCGNKIKMDVLHEIVHKELLAVIKQIRKDKEGYKEIVRRKLEHSKYGNFRLMEKKMETLDDRIQQIFEKKILGNISESDYINSLQQLNNEKMELNKKMVKLNDVKNKLLNFEDRYRTFLSNMESKRVNKLDFIRLLVSDVLIEDNKIVVKYKYE